MTNKEIDLLIHDKVMGRVLLTKEQAIELINTPDFADRINADELPPGYKLTTMDSKVEQIKLLLGGDVPPYSTEISYAWEVVEKMKMTISAPGAPVADGEYCNSSELWACEASWVRPKTGFRSDVATSSADPAPLAICLCALKAVGIEVERD